MASSSSAPATVWDVFLSFRGTDTRIGFTSHLHTSLHRVGVRTFIDEPELRAGDVIKLELHNAIKQSKIYIVVLSQNYASSGWCLDELAEILERGKSPGRLVLPIFYNIKPAVVRHQLWQFGEALGKHEGRFPREIVNTWRASLKEVADISGYHVTRYFRTEAEIIDEVVDRVLLEINPGTMYVAKYPVGIDSRVAKIKSLLDSTGNTIDGVHWIGIYGMGGVGKTTLAKAFYNQMSRRFEGSCFLADIKNVCVAPKGLESLQQQLIDDVLKRKNTTTISSIDRGINLIRERICSLKVLVVLDDCDHRNQVDSLVGKFLAAGSVIILTTRNADLLDAIKVEARHKVAALGVAESRKLFTKHAFGDTKIKEEFMGMSKEILDHAGGLPLALTVFGSILFEEAEKGWIWFINILKRVPIHDVEKNLMISFETLKLVDPELQDVFLDIACFFVGWKKDKAVERLETRYESIDHYISVLKKRSLITINENKLLSMHDLLQGMGRNIARNSRLIASEDIRDMLESNKGTEAIEGMVDSNCPSNGLYSCDAATFDRMPNLRFLRLFNVNMSGSFGKPFKDLRWLSWENCSNLPSNFCAQKLVILDLRLNNICRFAENALVLENLKFLDMSHSYGLSKTPDFNGLRCLETLNLSYCTSLVEVDVSIGNLEQLAALYLSFCRSLQSLPEIICKLRALKILNLKCCKKLEALPMELGNTESLTHLDVMGIHILNLPNSIGRLSKLVRLHLSLCMNLTTLPDIICKLRSLEILEIDSVKGPEELVSGNSTQLSNQKLPSTLKQLKAYKCMSLLKLPDLSNLQQLEKMHLSQCSSLREMEGLDKLISIKELHLEGCTSLKRLPDLSNLQQLEKMHLSGRSSLREMKGLDKLISIKELHFEGCTSLGRLPDLSNLQQLEKMYLSNCGSLRTMEGLDKLISIKEFRFQGCTSLNRLPDLSNLQQLKKMHISNCSCLVEMKGLDKLISIKEICFEGCTSLSRLPDLSNLQQLEKMHLSNCSCLVVMKGLDKLISIKEIRFEGCTSLNPLPDLSNLQQLEKMHLSNCSCLGEMKGFGKLFSIEELYLDGCTSVKRLSDVSDLQKLKSLTLKGCSRLTEIEGLEDVRSLTIINLSGCISLYILPDLSKLQKLKYLWLTNCSSLTKIEGLEDAISLTIIDLRGCISLKRLPNLSKLQQLNTLLLKGCSSLTGIEGLEYVLSITVLDVSGCKSLNTLPNLSNLRKLKTLELMDCSSLTEIQGLGAAVDITTLKFGGCKAMERLPNLSKLQQLKILQLSSCISLTEIQGLEDAISITHLDLTGCISLRRLPNLSNLQQLESLVLTDCSNLTEIEGVEKLISIRELLLGGCKSINRLPNLSNLQKLEYLWLTDCSYLTEIEGVEKLISIRKLHLGGCKSINRLPNLSNLQELEYLRHTRPSDGGVRVFEPFESEDMLPHDNVSASSVQMNWDFNNSVNENYRSSVVDTQEFNADLTLGWNTNEENRPCKRMKLDDEVNNDLTPASSSKTKKN